jgi:hypothetical protein
MTEPRRLVEIVTFEAANEMVIDDLAALIASADARAKAAQIADAEQPKPPAETPVVRTLFAVVGAKAQGFFK